MRRSGDQTLSLTQFIFFQIYVSYKSLKVLLQLLVQVTRNQHSGKRTKEVYGGHHLSQETFEFIHSCLRISKIFINFYSLVEMESLNLHYKSIFTINFFDIILNTPRDTQISIIEAIWNRLMSNILVFANLQNIIKDYFRHFKFSFVVETGCYVSRQFIENY